MTPRRAFFKDVELAVLEGVYEPREDSYLLAEAAVIPSGAKVLDLGTGSGIQAVNAALAGAREVWAVDVNPKALENARLNFERLKLKARLVLKESELFEEIPEKERFDVIVFNPPYLPSDELEDLAVDGGAEGRVFLDEFIEQFKFFLAPKGNAYFLQTDLNRVDKTEEKLRQLGLRFEIAARKKLSFEELFVFRCWA